MQPLITAHEKMIINSKEPHTSLELACFCIIFPYPILPLCFILWPSKLKWLYRYATWECVQGLSDGASGTWPAMHCILSLLLAMPAGTNDSPHCLGF